MKKSLFLIMLACSAFLLNACSGGGTTQPPPPVATHLSVTAPPTSTAGTPVSITVSALDASNNVVTSYTGIVHFTSTDAQAALPANSTLTNGTGTFSVTLKTAGSQTITATDTVTASITGGSNSITVSVSAACPSGNEKVFAGQYAFLFQGFDTSGPVALAGTFTADGAGGITTSGEEDLNNSAGVQTAVAINSGSYTVGSDHRGCLTITSATTPSPTTVTYRLALGLLNAAGIATSVRIIEFDATGTLGSGVIRLQDPTAFLTSAISGNYTFSASSTLSLTTASRFGVTGTFTSAGDGAITAGEEDFNISGMLDGGTPGPITFAGSYTVASDGRGTTTFNLTSPALTIHTSFYIVSAKELLLMSTDSQTSGNAPFTGTALQQPAGTTFSTSSLSGNSVLAASALCPRCGPASTPVVPVVDVGVMNVSTAGSWSAAFDDNRGGTLSSFTDMGTYTVDPMGRAFLTEPGQPSQLIIYLVSPNTGFLLDTGPAVGTGTLEPQSAGPFDDASLNGTFFVGTTNQVHQNVPDISAVETFDGVSTVSGTSDTASIGSSPSTPNLSPNQAFNSPYSVTNGMGTPGRVTATGTILYIISPSKIVLMDAAPSDVYPFILVGEQ
jgi:hypothetical protein